MAIQAWVNWKPGRSLRIRFLEGDDWQRGLVREVASEWTREANVTFSFDDDADAEIRIAFAPGRSRSYLGVECLIIPAHIPTMNLGWVDRETDEEAVRGTILHEFGHALGCLHEHQHPAAGIPWDKEVVYAYYQAEDWTREEVDEYVFETYSRTQTLMSAFDPASIMLYPIPEEHTIGDYSVPANNALSDSDRAYIRRIYPPSAEVLNLRTDGEPIQGEIRMELEEDHYRFAVEKPGSYLIETSGPTNIRMALFGPDNEGRIVASDDDSGIDGYNARIEEVLMAGSYALRIRHTADGVGTYEVRVQRVT